MSAILQVRRGPLSGSAFPIYSAAVTLLGRSASNHVVLRDRALSAVHCILVPQDEGFVVIDARSRTGLRINGQPSAKGTVRLGDVITIGPFELELRRGDHGLERPEPLRPAAARPSRFELSRRGHPAGLALPAGSATVIGRGALAHIRVEHPLISEYHCLIALDPADNGSMPLLMDLHSANGTFVNRRAIHRKHVLPGDAILIGRTPVEVRRLDVPQPAPRRRPKRPRPVHRGELAADTPVPPATPRADAPRPAAAPFRPPPAPEAPTPKAPPVVRARPAPWPAAACAAPEAAPPPEPEVEAPAPPPEDPWAVPLGELAAAERPGSTQIAPPLPEPTAAALPGHSATARALAEKPQAFRDFFGLRQEPFQHTPDPTFFYHSACHWEAFTTLNRWIETGPPLAVLFGEHGSGKTFLTACLARRLALISHWTVLVRPAGESARRDDLILEAVLGAAERYSASAFTGRTPLEVWRALMAEVRRRRSLFVFLIDDAHAIPAAHLLRLGDLVADAEIRGAVRILLAGEESLRELVARPPLADHLGVTCYLSPMAADDVAAYVLHRLSLASDEPQPLFTRRALELLTTYSGGIPRLINNVADAALYRAFLDGQREVTSDTVAQAIDELLRSDTPT